MVNNGRIATVSLSFRMNVTDKLRIGLMWLMIKPFDCCKCGNEPQCSLSCGEFLDWLIN